MTTPMTYPERLAVAAAAAGDHQRAEWHTHAAQAGVNYLSPERRAERALLAD